MITPNKNRELTQVAKLNTGHSPWRIGGQGEKAIQKFLLANELKFPNELHKYVQLSANKATIELSANKASIELSANKTRSRLSANKVSIELIVNKTGSELNASRQDFPESVLEEIAELCTGGRGKETELS